MAMTEDEQYKAMLIREAAGTDEAETYPTARDLFWWGVPKDQLTDQVRLSPKWRKIYDYYMAEAHRKAFSGMCQFGPSTFPEFEDWIEQSLRDFFEVVLGEDLYRHLIGEQKEK